jgi:pimeloyl-ACP methyl ester carboxylesterase
MNAEPFTPSFSPAAIADLRARLRSTRWPPQLGAGGGIALERVRALAGQWADRFDFEACAAGWSRHRHFRSDVQGLRLHFIHAPRSESPAVLLLHGWPGSFVEFLPMLELLAGDLSVVVASIPGFGYSPATPDLTPPLMADALAALMKGLGYQRWFVHGGDVGATVGTWIARRHPREVLGLHLNYIPGSYAPDPRDGLAPEEAQFLHDAQAWWERAGAYGHVQRTRPLTLGYALDDSPVALLAWITEKFDEWADTAAPVPDETILANVSLYWFTQTASSSVRYYLESARTPHRFAPGERVKPPAGITRFPLEDPFPPRRYIERAYDVRRFTEMPCGGHFAALEQPRLLASDLLAFIRDLQG